jgi:HSP20 family protein
MRKQYLVQTVFSGLLVVGLLALSGQVYADDTTQLKEQVRALQARVDQLESELANKQQTTTSTAMTASDQWENPLKQTGKQFVITMDIPGMDKDKINIDIKNGILIISGKRHSETQDNKDKQHFHQEKSFGSFMQSILLPEGTQADQIDAKYNNGVLTVKVDHKKKDDKKSVSEKIVIS